MFPFLEEALLNVRFSKKFKSLDFESHFNILKKAKTEDNNDNDGSEETEAVRSCTRIYVIIS